MRSEARKTGRSAARALLLGVVALGWGCSMPVREEVVATGDRLDRESCVCGLDKVCEATTHTCIARPDAAAGGIVGEVTLLRQERIGDITVLGKLGKGEASYHAAEPLPEDRRPSFTTAGGEKCFLEQDTVYPWSYGAGYWPSGPGRGAGTVTFDVGAAPGVVVLDPVDSSVGWGYFHDQTPPALHEGAAHYPDFFDPSVLPAAATFHARAAGGPHVGEVEIDGVLPAAFAVDEPPIELPGASVSTAEGFRVRWSPAQPSATMEIFVTRSIGMSFVLLSCKVADNGQALIPAEALRSFVGTTGLQLRRTTERYRRLDAEKGAVHLTAMGRNARLGSFTVVP
jgi:hypothetical protein